MMAPCAECGTVTGHGRRGLCQSCYDRRRYSGRLPDRWAPAPHPRKLHPTAAQIAEAVDAYHAGASLRVAADILGCAGHAARRILVEAGVEIRPQGRIPKRAAAQIVADRIVADYEAGASMSAVCERYRMGKFRVRGVLVAAGVEIRPAGGRSAEPEEIGYTGGWVRDGLVWRPVRAERVAS